MSTDSCAIRCIWRHPDVRRRPPAARVRLGIAGRRRPGAVIRLRIGGEEQLLARELEGYDVYREKVRYRLFRASGEGRFTGRAGRASVAAPLPAPWREARGRRRGGSVLGHRDSDAGLEQVVAGVRDDDAGLSPRDQLGAHAPREGHGDGQSTSTRPESAAAARLAPAPKRASPARASSKTPDTALRRPAPTQAQRIVEDGRLRRLRRGLYEASFELLNEQQGGE